MNTARATRHLYQTSRQALRHHHAPIRLQQLGLVPQRNLHTRLPTPSLLRKQSPSSSIANQIRCESSDTCDRPLTDRAEASQEEAQSQKDEIAARKAQEPAYELTFTCRKCMERSSHRITKQAYHFGTTLITCPGCKGRHLISDHMKIFSDKSITVEDILREKGQFLRKGRLGEDGDIEFYDEANNAIGQDENRKRQGFD